MVGCVDGGWADEYVIIEYSYVFGDCDVVDGETCVVGKGLSEFVGGFGCAVYNFSIKFRVNHSCALKKRLEQGFFAGIIVACCENRKIVTDTQKGTRYFLFSEVVTIEFIKCF